MSKQAWKVMIAVIGTLGAIFGLFFLSPLAPWRSLSPLEIPLAFPGEREEASFSNKTLEEFQRLSLGNTYYQIYRSDFGYIVIKAMGVKDDYVYWAEKYFEGGFGFNYTSFAYVGDTLILYKTFDFFGYLIGTIVILFIVGVVCYIIGVFTRPQEKKDS